ncbi:DNA 3'-phosphatase [Encephalitozoon hellem]|uniref:DNA 3'-phosphatase n=1 Tax=Encephalitozoon hellem TaxID=27973 RepID=A0ABY8CMQ6_ENCHE|nr:DNA 3'-phosphatase [Encephalitozoon hellem]
MKISHIEDGLLVIEHGEVNRSLNKLIMFDLDLTLICNSPDETSTDWRYLFREVPIKIKELNSQGYFIGIASNQSRLIRINALEAFVKKVCSILADLGVPIIFLAALKKNEYRKPSTGMYEYVCKEYIDESKITKKIYVGDAVNCSLGPGHTNSCDSKFAYNAGMEFKHPDEFFRGTQVIYFHDYLDIQKYRRGQFEADGQKEIVFVFGRRKHCGKRFFARKYFPDHKIISEKEFSGNLKSCVLINCKDKGFIEMVMSKHPDRYSIYYLNYPDQVINYLKTLAALSGEEDKEFVPIDPGILSIVKRYGVEVPFIFDSSGFGEKKVKLSRMQL